MNDLETLRGEIDGLDCQLTALLEQRMDICRQVGEYKIANHMNVLDSGREKTLLAEKAKLLLDPKKARDVQTIFETIMACSRRQQQSMMLGDSRSNAQTVLEQSAQWLDGHKEDAAILYQGQPGAYAEEAAMGHFGNNCDRTNLKSWDGVFRGVKEGFGDYGVIPIENSSTGSITDAYDLLNQFGCYIVGEEVVRVEHCLMAKPGTPMKKINQVYSHEQGFLQCRNFLGEYGKKWEHHEMANTALSAKFVAESDQPCGAIASRRAAELYGLEILQSRINDHERNYTRFIVVSKKPDFLKSADKLSISFSVPHTQGSLYRVLENFAQAGFNVLNLESRPALAGSWEYRFFADISGNLQDQAMAEVLKKVEEHTTNFRILGNYEGAK